VCSAYMCLHVHLLLLLMLPSFCKYVLSLPPPPVTHTRRLGSTHLNTSRMIHATVLLLPLHPPPTHTQWLGSIHLHATSLIHALVLLLLLLLLLTPLPLERPGQHRPARH
jgi:hypothetical protein